MTERLSNQIKFILEIDQLKSVIRRNFIRDGSRRENSAEHSWHIILTYLTLKEHVKWDDVNDLKVIQLLAIHDLVEIYAGDVFLFDAEKNEGKFERELEAASKLFGILEDDQKDFYTKLWLEFEEQKTIESNVALCIDRLIPVILNSHNGGESWSEANITISQVLPYMDPIRNASESLWELFNSLIQKAIDEGKIKNQ